MRIIPDDIRIETGELLLTPNYSIYGVYYYAADTIEITDEEWHLIYIGYEPKVIKWVDGLGKHIQYNVSFPQYLKELLELARAK